MAISADGKTILITGGNSGIGFAAAEKLVAAGAKVTITSRDKTRLDAAVNEISQRTGRTPEGMVLDLGSFAGIRAFAERYAAGHSTLDVLANNAGALFLSREVTEDGFEKTWAVNHLGPMLLTSLLLPLLSKSAAGRVVTTASTAHLGGKIAFDGLGLPHTYSRTGAYGRSKLANVLFSFALARKLEASRVTSNCFHPGVVATGFFRALPMVGPMARVLATPFLRTPEKGAETLVWLAGDTEAEGTSGGYYVDKKPGRLNPIARDIAVQERVWDVSCGQTGAHWAFD